MVISDIKYFYNKNFRNVYQIPTTDLLKIAGECRKLIIMGIMVQNYHLRKNAFLSRILNQ